MAQHIVLILNQSIPQIQEPQVGDTYLMPRNVEVQGSITLSGTVDGRDVATDGTALDTAVLKLAGIANGAQVNVALASQGEAEAGADNTKTMTPLRVAQAIAVLAASIQNNYTANVNPTTTDDNTLGYAPGSVWINLVTDEAYRCVDSTTNLAVWVNTTLTAAELATVGLSGNSDDLTEGIVKLLLTVAERAKVGHLTVTAGINLDTVAASITSLTAWQTDAFSIATGLGAYAGGGQANATALTAKYNQVLTVASGGDSVKLPTASAGKRCHVLNRGAFTMALFPDTGDNIESVGVNASVNVSSGSFASLVAIDATNWYYV